MSILQVDNISGLSGTDITIEVGKAIKGAASQFKITGGTAGQALITDGAGGITFGEAGSSFPTQTGQSGKFLTTDGTDTSWATVAQYTLPTQSGQSGKYLTTNGTIESWGIVDALPTQTSNAGKFLTTDGTDASWIVVPDEIPSQTSNSGKYLTTDGTTVSWADVAGGASYDTETTATGYLDFPVGTTLQRPGSPASGNTRFNSETGTMEHYDGTSWVNFAGTIPVITSIGPTTAAEAGTAITINGAFFRTGITVHLIGSDNSQILPTSVTYIDTNTLSMTTPPTMTVALEPWDVKVTNPDGQTYTLVNALDAGAEPAWNTVAGSLGGIFDNILDPATVHFTLDAGPDPDNSTVTFTEVDSAGEPLTGSGRVLTQAGLTLNSSTGAITGATPTTQTLGTSTVYNFKIEASDGVNKMVRDFSITVGDLPTGGDISTYVGNDPAILDEYNKTFRVHTFKSTAVFGLYNDLIQGKRGGIVDGRPDILVIAGGASGGMHNTTNGNGGGGAGGVVVASRNNVPAGQHTITVGAGGPTTGWQPNSAGTDGGDSVFHYPSNANLNLIAVGGGGGGTTGGTHGRDGGSGGGGARHYANAGATTQQTAGTPTTVASSPGDYGTITSYGSAGGSGGCDWTGSGGGGAGGAGFDGGPCGGTASNGGYGIENKFALGDDCWYAGGGGGAGNSSEHAGIGWHGGGRGYGGTQDYGHGDTGGSGSSTSSLTHSWPWTGWPGNSTNPDIHSTHLGARHCHAIHNTGGGGGAGSYWSSNAPWGSYGSGNGGSGVVVIRYLYP